METRITDHFFWNNLLSGVLSENTPDICPKNYPNRPFPVADSRPDGLWDAPLGKDLFFGIRILTNLIGRTEKENKWLEYDSGHSVFPVHDLFDTHLHQ
jgi:hypothetical protein